MWAENRRFCSCIYYLWLKARLAQLVPISFCSYNFGRHLCGDWNGPGLCLCFCMQSRLQVSMKLRLCTSSEQHSQERMGPDRSGKSVLKAITSFEMQSSSKIFSWKRHLKHVLREKEQMQIIKKKIFKFPIVFHTSSALQFSEMCCIYILLYSLFLYMHLFLKCICFSVRLFNSSAEHIHLIRHCRPQHYSKMDKRPEKGIKCFSYLL